RLLIELMVPDPWRYGAQGVSVALRVTPRGGRDDIDGIETLANGRTVLKIRVRALAEGGEANRAVTELLSKALRVPKAKVKILSGMTAQIIDGKKIAADLRARVAAEVARVKSEHALTPGLAVVLVGQDPASQVYVRSKHKQTQE